MGTNEAMLTEAVMGKTTVQLQQMRHLYQQRYGTSMDKAIRDDLSMKTEKLFTMALEARKPEEHIPATPQQAQADAVAIYKATKGRIGTDELAVCRIFTQSNVAQLKAIVYEYERQHGSLVECIKKEFSGHMRDALLFILEGAIDPVRRDAVLLEMSMKGLGTKDDLLIMRVVRCHWNRIHMESVKNAYKNLYKRSLADRIKGETSGHYREMLLALVA